MRFPKLSSIPVENDWTYQDIKEQLGTFEVAIYILCNPSQRREQQYEIVKGCLNQARMLKKLSKWHVSLKWYLNMIKDTAV